MFRYFMGNQSRANLAYDTFIKWVNSYQEFLRLAERRALKISPAHKRAWQNAFRLQRLLKRRQSLRFEYLFSRGKLDLAGFKSLDSIAERSRRAFLFDEGTLLESCPTLGNSRCRPSAGMHHCPLRGSLRRVYYRGPERV